MFRGAGVLCEIANIVKLSEVAGVVESGHICFDGADGDLSGEVSTIYI